MFGRLMMFSTLLLPGWIGMVRYWLLSPNIIRNIEYGQGARKRNLLDVYLPPNYSAGGEGVPVVVFVTGKKRDSQDNILILVDFIDSH